MVAAIGALVSFALYFRATDHPPLLIHVLFGGWIIGPYVLLAGAIRRSPKWPQAVQTAICACTIAIASLMITSFANPNLKPTGSPRAFVFVMVPPALLAIAAVVIGIAGYVTRHEARGSRT